MKSQIKLIINTGLILITLWAMGCSILTETEKSSNIKSSGWVNYDTIKAGKFDTGKMWTFDFPPYQYFKEEYNFTPDEEWMDNVRMSGIC